MIRRAPTVCRSLISFPEGHIYSRKVLSPLWQAIYLNKLPSIAVRSLPNGMYER